MSWGPELYAPTTYIEPSSAESIRILNIDPFTVYGVRPFGGVWNYRNHWLSGRGVSIGAGRLSIVVVEMGKSEHYWPPYVT